MANLFGALGKSLEDWAYNTFYSDTQKKNDAAVKASNQQAQAHAQMKAGQINPVQYKRQAAIAANSIAPAYSAPAPQQQGYAPQAPSRPQIQAPRISDIPRPQLNPTQQFDKIIQPKPTIKPPVPQNNSSVGFLGGVAHDMFYGSQKRDLEKSQNATNMQAEAHKAYKEGKISKQQYGSILRQAADSANNTTARSRIAPELKKGLSYKDIAQNSGYSTEEVKDYVKKYNPSYGDRGLAMNALGGVKDFGVNMLNAGAGIVTKPIHEATANRAADNDKLKQINADFKAGNITGAAAMERAQAIADPYINKKVNVSDDGTIGVGSGNALDFLGKFTMQGVDTASVLPVGGAFAKGAGVGLRWVGKSVAGPTLSTALTRTGNMANAVGNNLMQTTINQTSSKIAEQLATRGMNIDKARIIGNALTNNAKEAGIYGTLQTGSDIAQGNFTPEGALMNYGGQFALGAVGELGLGAAGTALGKGIRTAPTPERVVKEHPEIQGLETTAKQYFDHRNSLIDRGLSPNSTAVRAVDNAIRKLGKEYDKTYKRLYEMQTSGGSVPAGMFDPTGGKLGKQPDVPKEDLIIKNGEGKAMSIDPLESLKQEARKLDEQVRSYDMKKNFKGFRESDEARKLVELESKLQESNKTISRLDNPVDKVTVSQIENMGRKAILEGNVSKADLIKQFNKMGKEKFPSNQKRYIDDVYGSVEAYYDDVIAKGNAGVVENFSQVAGVPTSPQFEDFYKRTVLEGVKNGATTNSNAVSGNVAGNTPRSTTSPNTANDTGAKFVTGSKGTVAHTQPTPKVEAPTVDPTTALKQEALSPEAMKVYVAAKNMPDAQVTDTLRGLTGYENTPAHQALQRIANERKLGGIETSHMVVGSKEWSDAQAKLAAQREAASAPTPKAATMQEGRTNKALDGQIRYNGTVMDKRQYIDALVKDGYAPQVKKINGKDRYVMEHSTRKGDYYVVTKTEHDLAKSTAAPKVEAPKVETQGAMDSLAKARAAKAQYKTEYEVRQKAKNDAKLDSVTAQYNMDKPVDKLEREMTSDELFQFAKNRKSSGGKDAERILKAAEDKRVQELAQQVAAPQVTKTPTVDPTAALKQEALKYKSADEYLQALADRYQEATNTIHPDKVPQEIKALEDLHAGVSLYDSLPANKEAIKKYTDLYNQAHTEAKTPAPQAPKAEAPKPTLQDALAGKSTKIKETTSTAQELTPRQVQTSQPVASPQKTPQQSKQDPSLIQTPESGVSTPKNQGDANITLSTDNTRNVPKNQVRVKAGSGEKQVPVRNMTRDGDVIIATNVNKDIKAGEKRYSVDEDGKLIEDKKGATSLFTDKDGKVTGFRVGKEYFDAKQLGDLTSVNGYGSTLATMRRNVERAFDKPTGEKVNTFLVDHQQAQATKLIQRQVALKNEMQGLADDLGISFGIGSKKAKKVSAAIQDFGEGKRNKQNLVDEFGQVQANKIVKADKWFRKNYNSLLDEMNTTLKQFGYDPIPKRANYYTHFQDETLWKKVGLKMQEIRDLSSPTMQDANPTAGRGNISNILAGMSENTVPNKAFNRFALKRKGDAHTSDAFKAFELYLNPTLNNIYMTPSIARARVIARAIAQDADIVGKDANKTIVQIREWANSLAGKSNRIGDRQLADTMAGPYVLKALGWAQKKTGQNSIIGNLSTAVMQPIVLGQTAGTFGYKNTLAGLYQQGLGSLNKAQSRSGFLTRRYSNVSPVTATKLDRGAVIANKPLEFVEENATRATWNAAYNDAVSQGMKGEKAIHYADINTEKTVSGRSIGEKPEAFRSKTAGLATMFQLEVNNFWQQTGKEMSKTQIAKTMVAMYGLNLLLQEMTGRQVGFNPIDALIDSYDEATKERPSEGAAVGERAKRIGQRWVGEAVDNLPFVGMAVNTAFGEQTVKDWTGDDSNTGRFGVASPIRTLVDNPWMTVSPFGGSQVKKTVEAGMVLNDGALKDKDGKVLVNVPQTPGNIVRGLAFGKSAIPEVNQYYNNLGKNKVDQKQVQNQTGSKAGTMSLDGLTQAQQRMLSTARDDMKQHLIDRFRKENKDKYTADKAKDLNKPANDTPSTDAASQLLEANKMRAEDLKNSLSKEDYAISQLSKKDAQKLISEGKLTQQKLDGVNNYIANKKKELGYDTTTTSSGIRKGAEDTGWTDEYNAAKSKYDKESSSWNPVEKEKKGKELRTLDVKRHYSKEATSLYDMNEKDIYGFLDRQDEKKAQSYYKQIVEYGDKMVEAGLWSTNKLRDKYGNLQYERGYVAANGKLAKGGSKSSGRATGGRKASTGRKPSGGSGGRSGGDVTSGKALLALQTGLNKIKTPRTTGKTPMPKSSVPVPPSFNKKNLRKFAVKSATLTAKKARA